MSIPFKKLVANECNEVYIVDYSNLSHTRSSGFANPLGIVIDSI